MRMGCAPAHVSRITTGTPNWRTIASKGSQPQRHTRTIGRRAYVCWRSLAHVGMERTVSTKSAWIAFGVALAASIFLVTNVFFPLWQPVFMAAVLATATYRPFEFVKRRLHGRKRIAATLMTIAIVVLLLIPASVIVTVAVREAVAAFELVRSALQKGGVEELVARLPDQVEGPLRNVLETLHVRLDALAGEATTGGFTVAKILGELVTGVSHFFFQLAMMLIAYYALLTEGKRLLAWIEEVSPLRGQQTLELLTELKCVSGSVLRSTVLTAAAQSAVATIGYLITGVPNTVFFGFLTFFAAFVPSVGTSIVAVPLSLVLLLFGHTWQGIFLLLWSTAVVGLVDNLLKPFLIRGGMQLHGVIIFFALLGGAIVFGPIGLLVGPLSVTFFLAMIRFGYRDSSPPRPDEPKTPRSAPATPSDAPQPAGKA